MASPPSAKRRRATRIARNHAEPFDLHAAWPEVQRTLLRTLSRRVDRHTAEDICQDVAERWMTREVSFDTVEDLVRWAQRVASNRATDEWRTYGRRQSGEPVPERASAVDVARVVTHRAAIDEAAVAIRTLRPEERAALLRADSPDIDLRDARERQRDANLRERARERLRGMVHNFPAGVGERVVDWWRRRWPLSAPSPNALVAIDWGHLLAGAGLALVILAVPFGGDGGAGSRGGGPGVRGATSAAAIGWDPARSGIGPASSQLGAAGAGGSGDRRRLDPSASGNSSRQTIAAVSTPVKEGAVGTSPNEPGKPLVCIRNPERPFELCPDQALPPLPLPVPG